MDLTFASRASGKLGSECQIHSTSGPNFAALPPVKLPDGRKLETLSDLRAYILALPKREQARCGCSGCAS